MVVIPAGFAASQPARDVVLPIIGRTTSGGGASFDTTVWITNVSSRRASMTLKFLAAGKSSLAPPQSSLTLRGGETRVFAPGNLFFPHDNSVGALLIESNAPIVAAARITSRESNDMRVRTISFAGIPTRMAIGNGQSTILQGFGPPPERYKIYIVEVAGEPLNFNLIIRDSQGNIVRERRLIISPYEQRPMEITSLFPSGAAWCLVTLEGINGSGRIVAAGLQLQPTGTEATTFEMSASLTPRTRIPWPEAATYILVALAVIVAAVVRR
jgi:hypothetical protein